MRVTIQEIAKQLSLSTATVSRALNQRDDAFISTNTRERVLQTAAEMGYQPNQAARALVTGRTNLVALGMIRMDEPYYSSIIHQVQKEATQRGYGILIGPMSKHPGQQPGPTPSQWSADGLLACDFTGTEEAFQQSVKSTPAVSMGNYYVHQSHYVGIDLTYGARQAVEHLIEIGCKRIAHIMPGYVVMPGDGRGDTYDACMKAAGLPTEYITIPHATRRAGYEATLAHVREHGVPDGLFCRNDLVAIGAYCALRELNVSVPFETAIVGCDGIEDTLYLETPISTIVQPVEEMCRLAWEFLQNCIADPELPFQQVLLKPQFVIRASSQRGFDQAVTAVR